MGKYKYMGKFVLINHTDIRYILSENNFHDALIFKWVI